MCIATLAAIGTAVSAAGTVIGGISQGNQAAYQAQVADNNALIAKQNAAYASAAAQQKAATVSMAEAEKGGAIKAGLAANNIDVNTGSASNLLAGQRELGKLNAETTLNQGELQAYADQTQATGFEARAGLDRQQAEEAPIAGILGGTGTLLSNANKLPFGNLGQGGTGNSWTNELDVNQVGSS